MTDSKDEVFIVRLWEESENSPHAQWRGSVVHSASKQQFYFMRIADMADFISFHLSHNKKLDSIEPKIKKEENDVFCENS